ncbi:MAG TPA: vanadium-dependent haloperoxidase, partial [Alphaproteobacteria bacterium]|nr:vanadium-dependent haloperoxidase [Alphaproteobacteria bacterium]
SDTTAGLALGRAIAARAVAWGKADGSDAKWTGSVPNAPDKWRGTNPLGPMVGTWKTWVLQRPDELRPPAPLPPQLAADLAELKAVQRTPAMLSAAWFWEWGAGGFRGFQFWNDQASRKTIEYRLESSPPHAARIYALESIAFHDAVVACWEAKYAYWAPRPFMVDAELKPLFPAPNHPSYPAAHGCLSTAAASVLAQLFPYHAREFAALGDQAAEARVWAGIHFRADVHAGKAIGRAVAEKVMAAVAKDMGR